MMLGDDVINLKGEIKISLGDLAVFTAVFRPLPYEGFQRAFHACSVGLGFSVILISLKRLPRF